jgi:hypothetical protein
MAKYGSASALILVDGYKLTALKPKSLTFDVESVTERTDGLGDACEEVLPVGQKRATLEIGGGFFDTATASSHAAFSTSLPATVQATPRVACFGFEGQTKGARCVCAAGAYTTKYAPAAALETLTKANVTHQITGRVKWGQIIQPLATKTADWNTKTDGDEVDYADDTTQRVIPITSNSAASPSIVTTPVPHGLTTGDKILISGVSDSDADINGEQTVTVISDLTFSVAVDASTHAGTGGSFVRTSTANGAIGFLHVTECSGLTNFVGKLRDSPDNSTFADLVTFSDNVSAPFAETVSVSGAVDRYVAFDGNVTGTGSLVPFCALVRL